MLDEVDSAELGLLPDAVADAPVFVALELPLSSPVEAADEDPAEDAEVAEPDPPFKLCSREIHVSSDEAIRRRHWNALKLTRNRSNQPRRAEPTKRLYCPPCQ